MKLFNRIIVTFLAILFLIYTFMQTKSLASDRNEQILQQLVTRYFTVFDNALKVKDEEKQKITEPIEIICVVDISGSMTRRKN